MSIENNSSFVPLEQVRQKIISVTGTDDFWNRFQNYCLFLRIKDKDNGEEYIFHEDIPYYLRLAKLNTGITRDAIDRFNGTTDLFSVFLKISDNTGLYFSNYSENCQIPAFVRNLFYYPILIKNPVKLDSTPCQFNLMGVTVITYELQIKEYMHCVLKRKEGTDRIWHSNFINTASYIGNKKRISSFIFEALSPHISDECSFVDLMCGSGSMSHIFAQFGVTYASDAQEFCQLLAKIQGNGFTKERAKTLLDQFTEYYRRNYLELKMIYQKQLDNEASLYRRDWSDKTCVLSMFNEYVAGFLLYSSTDPIPEWLDTLVAEYKHDNKKFPYCLFTLYFSNVFFGLHQCIQLDSLRYAVDQFSGEDKLWCLGVLVTTAYQISSGHANHFAQPKRITERNIYDILEKRNKSAFHEFSKRLLSLAEESELVANRVEILKGPWQNALALVSENVAGEILVYLDAPYKRDEYSRYYHVLETITKYDYPSSEFKGRVRSKRLNERFSTEFFTKNINRVEKIFIDIVSTILSSNMTCVWSYSDNGDASIINVVNGILERVSCKIYLYGTIHNHQSQRGSNHNISVIEYCIIFCPMHND